MARNVELEDRLRENPNDTAGFLVYADFLQSHGDPRGELIALHHAGKSDDAAAFIEEHADELLGPLRRYEKTLDGSDVDAFEWNLGFIRRARLSLDTNCIDGRELSLPEALAALLEHPSGALLEELVIGVNMLDDGCYLEPLVKTIAEHGAPSLRKLRLGEFNCAGPGGTGDHDYEISWTGLGDASGLWAAVPRLEHLVIQSGLGDTALSGVADQLGTIDHPRLRHLEIITGGMKRACVEAVANANLPSVETLIVWFGDPSYGFEGGIDDIQPILDGPRLPKLQHLGLCNADFTDDICRRLGGARILKQLKTLSLAYGTMSDEGAEALAAAKPALAHLERLNLDENFLTARGVGFVTGLCAEVSTNEQRNVDDYDGESYVSLGE
jgi:uncharacterized protein (TIGR02996 family)